MRKKVKKLWISSECYSNDFRWKFSICQIYKLCGSFCPNKKPRSFQCKYVISLFKTNVSWQIRQILFSLLNLSSPYLALIWIMKLWINLRKLHISLILSILCLILTICKYSLNNLKTRIVSKTINSISFGLTV